MRGWTSKSVLPVAKAPVKTPGNAQSDEIQPGGFVRQMTIYARRKGSTRWVRTACRIAEPFAAKELAHWQAGKAVGFTCELVVPPCYPLEAGWEFELREVP